MKYIDHFSFFFLTFKDEGDTCLDVHPLGVIPTSECGPNLHCDNGRCVSGRLLPLLVQQIFTGLPTSSTTYLNLLKNVAVMIDNILLKFKKKSG